MYGTEQDFDTAFEWQIGNVRHRGLRYGTESHLSLYTKIFSGHPANDSNRPCLKEITSRDSARNKFVPRKGQISYSHVLFVVMSVRLCADH